MWRIIAGLGLVTWKLFEEAEKEEKNSLTPGAEIDNAQIVPEITPENPATIEQPENPATEE